MVQAAQSHRFNPERLSFDPPEYVPTRDEATSALTSVWKHVKGLFTADELAAAYQRLGCIELPKDCAEMYRSRIVEGVRRVADGSWQDRSVLAFDFSLMGLNYIPYHLNQIRISGPREFRNTLDTAHRLTHALTQFDNNDRPFQPEGISYAHYKRPRTEAPLAEAFEDIRNATTLSGDAPKSVFGTLEETSALFDDIAERASARLAALAETGEHTKPFLRFAERLGFSAIES